LESWQRLGGVVRRLGRPSDVTVGIVQERGGEEVRVTLTEWQGDRRVDLRTFGAADGPEEPHASPLGVVIDVHRLGQLIDDLERARRQALQLGWLREPDRAPPGGPALETPAPPAIALGEPALRRRLNARPRLFSPYARAWALVVALLAGAAALLWWPA
jgi:hypothetical protein